MFCTFWLANVLIATAACNFSTSQLQKVVRACQFFDFLTCKCASRYSGVQFFHIRSSEHVSFLTFWVENVLLATAACNFSTSQLQKVVRACQFFSILNWKCASRYSGVQFFICPLNSYLRTRRFTKPTVRPSRPTNHWKNTAFRDFPNILREWIFFLLTLLLLCFSSSDSTLLCSAFSTVHIVGSWTSKLSLIISLFTFQSSFIRIPIQLAAKYIRIEQQAMNICCRYGRQAFVQPGLLTIFQTSDYLIAKLYDCMGQYGRMDVCVSEYAFVHTSKLSLRGRCTLSKSEPCTLHEYNNHLIII